MTGLNAGLICVGRSQTELYFLLSELGATLLARIENVRILIIEAPFIHLTIVHVEASCHFSDLALVPCVDILLLAIFEGRASLVR